MPSGGSALEEVGADLVVAGGPVEGYVPARDMDGLVGDHEMIDGSGPANVVLHVVVDGLEVPWRVGVAVPAAVALDLIEWGDPRSVGTGWALWAQALAEARGAV